MSHHLRRYWFNFKTFHMPTPLNLGCGVTAYDYDDAVGILKQSVFKDIELPKITRFVEDIDISLLDKGHVLPNMEPPNSRGVWFPKGYVE